MHDPAELERDIARLQESFARTLAWLDGDDAATTCRELGELARTRRTDPSPGAQRALHDRVAAQSDRALEQIARAYTLWCHLMNVAEERERLRVLRMRGEHPADGLRAAIDRFVDAGAGEDDVRALLDRALVMPVLTAHPTEARRRSSLVHLGRIAASLDALDANTRTRAAHSLDAAVLALHATEQTRARRPTPLDEVEAALDAFRRTLLDVTPHLYRTIEDRLRERFAITWRVPAFFRWGSWVGGDRDGNPHVTAETTRRTFARHRALVLARYLDDIRVLGRSLSISVDRRRTPAPPAALAAALDRARAHMPEVAAHAMPRTVHEPWREMLWYVQARLQATAAYGDDAYPNAAAYREDLALLDRTLREAGFAALADEELRDAIRRVEVFGFHLASLDIRQHSALHARVVDELLGHRGRAGYAAADEATRRAILREVLAHPIPPLADPDVLSAEAREVLAVLDVAGRARRDLGAPACERYIISFAQDVSDLLEIALLARTAGLAPGELRPVPLLEQRADLARAGELARDLLADPVLRAELGGQLEVMIGYSDSGKEIGYVASTVALQHAQLALVEATRDSGVTLTLFHGRGGAIGRGGGPAGAAIRAQPPAAVRGRLRTTEQGETVTARYTHPAIAERDLELMLAAVIDVARSERAGSAPTITPVVDAAADAARHAYLELTADADRLTRYAVAATPLDFIAHLAIGSRPAARKPAATLDALRAIPWVFAWTQSRHGIPGWFGVGTALEEMARQLGAAAARALVEDSRFLRAVIANCDLSLVRSDIGIAGEYARLAEPDTMRIFELIAREHERTVRALRDVLGRAQPLASHPYLASSVVRRNPPIDVLSHVQIEAMRRRRAGTGDIACLEQAIATTIAGIAAGLQTVG